LTIETSVLVSAGAGLASFFSPCILPILPGFISFLSGTAINEAKNTTTTIANSTENVNIGGNTGGQGQQKQRQQRSAYTMTLTRTRLNIFLNTLYFVLGFSLIFVILGVILNSRVSTSTTDTVYLDGQWKNNPDNMELQSNTGRIILTYYAKDVNIVAGGHGQKGIVTEDGTTEIPTDSLGKDLTPDGKFVLDGQRLYNLALHRNYDLIPL
jgi:hypothetical protein